MPSDTSQPRALGREPMDSRALANGLRARADGLSGSTDIAWRKTMHGLPSALSALPSAAFPYNSRHGQVSVDRGLPVSCGVGRGVWVMAGCHRETLVGAAP